MPLPMVHLAVAVQLRRLEGNDPSPGFLLGSIAPDAIHMRPDAGREDKQRVHLFESEVVDTNHEGVRLLLEQYGSDSSSQMGLAEGYVAHVLTDQLWFVTVFDSFRKDIPPGLSRQEFRSLYYAETDQIDFDLYHQMPWREDVWRKLAIAQPKDLAQLVSAEEMERWRDRTLIWFEELTQEPAIEPVYITRAQVQAFVNRAADETRRALAALRSRDRDGMSSEGT